MRRDRTGEVVEDDEDAAATAHACDSGWTGHDAEGRPRPCLTCRPWLARPFARTKP